MSRCHPADSHLSRPFLPLTMVCLIAACCSRATIGAEGKGLFPTVSGDQDQQAFFDPTMMDPAVPSPESVIGHAVGEGAVRYEQLVRYLKVLEKASPFVTLTRSAESHEGRTLYYLTITSRENHARLAAIRADAGKLADPRKLENDQEAQRILGTLPGIAWLAYSIHGDELSSTDAAIMVAYRLAAGTGELTRRMRKELVVHIDPLQNPDGRERYLNQLQTLTGEVANPDYQAMQHSGLWAAGRGNHYLFDLNRDWLMMTQPETRGRAAVILSWNPHLLVDSHEMGSLDTYLFDPPRKPYNVMESEKNQQWRRQFSADQARAFDRQGWSYYTQEWYEEWYPGYTNSWANLLGTIGLLYEQAGVNAASVKQATGQETTYREAVHHHYVSSLANLETLRVNRRAILKDYLVDRRWAVSEEGPHGETFLLSPAEDRSKGDRFVDTLRRQGIEIEYATAPFEAKGMRTIEGETSETKSFPEGTLIVRSNQPHRRLLHAILGFDPHMSDASLLREREELEKGRGSLIYDITAWNLAMAYGFDAVWADRVGPVASAKSRPAPKANDWDWSREAGYGYIINGADGDLYRLVLRLLDRDCRVRIASKPVQIGGKEFPRGSALLRIHENPEGLRGILHDAAEGLTPSIISIDTALSDNGWDLGGQRFHLLEPPRVAICSQWPVSTTSFGAAWFALDQRLELRASPINIQRLGGMDLRKYNVLVLPAGFGLSRVLNKSAVQTIKTWVEAGGTLITSGGSTAFIAAESNPLSRVRLRRDVLDQLDEYTEAVQREIAARSVSIDAEQVWGNKTSGDDAEKDASEEGVEESGEPGATTQKTEAEHRKSPSDKKARERLDEWRRIFSPRGSIVQTRLDPEHWLCFGLGERLPVLFSGGNAYLSKRPIQTPVRLMDKDHLRLSGLLWPEARMRLTNSAYATVERRGNGQVIAFASDPFFRGYTEGTGRLFFNAVVFGPGIGTSQPMPW